MFTPQTYAAALALMTLSMFCWGTWANTQKATGSWPFSLYYFDYTLGLVLCSLAIGLTFGRLEPSSALSFFPNLHSASERSIALAFAGGAVFSVGNILIVAAISVAGMAVAFPIGAGLALVLGAILNYIVSPVGNPILIFGGVALVIVAIVLDALAYRGLSSAKGSTGKGIAFSFLGGIGSGLFYPFVAKSLAGPRHLTPYGVNFVFAFGALATAIPMVYWFMRRPVTGSKQDVGDYTHGPMRSHAWGFAGGIIWGVGTIANFLASYVPMIGPATSFAMGAGNTMISALWGVFVWREFRGAGMRVRIYLVSMFLFFLLGLTSIALSPVVK